MSDLKYLNSKSKLGNDDDDEKSINKSNLIMSKFNTVYRHSVLDILTHYTEIPTDPNPDNNKLSTKNPSSHSNNQVSPILINSKKQDSISNIKIKSLDFNELTISFNHPLIDLEMIRPIKFESKCNNWSDVQKKLITMSKISANSRNLSNLRVSGISYPISILNLLLIFAVLLLPFGYFYPTLLYDNFFSIYLPFMMIFKRYHNLIFFTTILIHLSEFYLLLLPRLKKYRVPLDYAIEWSILILLDGYESIKRFDSYVNLLSSDDVYYDFTNDDYFL